jgi:LysR family transcriptional regulator, low CO2-responsive transcriptional regulator
MNLRHLGVFYAIATAGSVNAAAQRLHTSQPAVSRELRTLEERLGVCLFDRLPRGMRPTEAGQVLLSYAAQIFGLEQAAERALRELADLEGGELAIGASNTLGTYLLPPFIAAFHVRYPKVNLALEVGNTQEIAKGVVDSRFGLGFVEGQVRDPALEAKEFRRDRIVAVVPPGHPLTKANPLTLQALAAAPSLLREPGSGTREIVEAAFARHRLKVRCSLQIGNSEALKRASMEGGGVGWISEACVTEELRYGRLVALETSRLSLERPLYTLRLRGRHPNRSAIRFLQEFASARLGAEAPTSRPSRPKVARNESEPV